METALDVGEFADLIVSTGEKHHEAYRASDGVDPEWALWYAGYLQAAIWDRAGTVPSRSRLVHLLVEAERRYPAADHQDWPTKYARLLLDDLGRS